MSGVNRVLHWKMVAATLEPPSLKEVSKVGVAGSRAFVQKTIDCHLECAK